MNNTQEPSQSLSSSGVPCAGQQPVPGRPQLGCDPARPLQQMTFKTLPSRTLLCELSQWQACSRCGEPWTPCRPTWPRPSLFVARSYYALCWPALLRRPLTVPLGLRPNVDGGRWSRLQEGELHHRVTPCGPRNHRARRPPPRSCGVASADSRQRWGRCNSRRRGNRWFPESGLAHTVRVHGACGSGSSHGVRRV